MRTGVVVNPASARGRTARRWPEIAAILAQRIGAFECSFTQGPGGAVEVTRALLRSGCERIVAVGGDGTFNEAANAFLSEPNEAALGLMPVATAGDLPRMLGIPSDPAQAADIIAEGRLRIVDAGKISFRGGERYFLNMVSFGLGGQVAGRVKHSRLPFSYPLHTIATLASSQPARITVSIDGGPGESVEVSHAAIGNGQFNGKGMRVCPLAQVDDGLLDVTVIEPVGVAEVLRNALLIYNGRIYSHPKVRHRRAQRVTATSEETVLIEIDGEAAGRLPLEATVVPGGIRLIAPGC